MLRWAGQKGRRLAIGPGLETGLVEGRKRVAALTARHMEYPIFFLARGNDEPFRGAEAAGLNARHIAISRQLPSGKVQALSEIGHSIAHGMLDMNPIGLAPGLFGKRATIL